MAISININLNLSGLSNTALRNALENRINALTRESYNKLSKELLKQGRDELASSSKSASGLNTLGGPYRPRRFQKSGGPFTVNKVPWGKFWYAQVKDETTKKARVYLGCGNGTKVLEVNYDFLFSYQRLENITEDTVQNGINDIVPDWVGGGNQLLKNTDFPPGTFLPPSARFAAGNSTRGYIYTRNGNQWVYLPMFTELSLLNTGPFWLGQHLLYDYTKHYFKLEHLVLPYKEDRAVIVVYGSNVIQQRKIDMVRSIFAGGDKGNVSTKQIIMHSPFRYSITQNDPTHEYVVGKKSPSFTVTGISARMAPYPNGSLSQFDENQTIRFQIMAGPEVGPYYANGAISAESLAVSQQLQTEPVPEWYKDCYAVTPILTVTTVPVNPSGDSPDDHGYDLDDIFSFNIVNGGSTAPRVYRSRASLYGYQPGETFTQPENGHYIFIRIHSVRDKFGEDIYPIQDTSGYSYNRDYHQCLFIDIATTDDGTVGPTDASATSFYDACDVIDNRFQQDVHVDADEEPLVKCFLVSDTAIKQISTPSAVKDRVIPRVIGTRTQTNQTIDEGGNQPIPENFIVAQTTTGILNWACGSDALDTEQYGPQVTCSAFSRQPVNKIYISENFTSPIYPSWTAGTNSGISNHISYAQNNADRPITTGYKNADRITMKKRTVNTYYQTADIFNAKDLNLSLEVDKNYVISFYCKWAGTGEVEPSYPGEVVDNSKDAILGRTFFTLQHINESGLVDERVVSKLGFEWTRQSLMFKYTGKQDTIRISNWNNSEYADLDIHLWGCQLEEFTGQLQAENSQEGPSEYQKRGPFTQVYYTGIYPDYYARKQNLAYPVFSVDSVPIYQYIRPEIGGYTYEDFPIDLGIKGQEYNWIDAATWRNFDPQAGDYINPIDAPFSKWSPVIYDVIFNDTYPGDGTGTSRGDYNAPTFDVGPKSGERNAENEITKTSLNYKPTDYESNPPYDAIIQAMTEGTELPDGTLKKGQRTARLFTQSDNAIYGPFKTVKTQSINLDTVDEFEEINKKKFRNRYNWSLDSQQMRLCQFTDFNRAAENKQRLLELGFTELDLKF
jgi:hypothetical protein